MLRYRTLILLVLILALALPHGIARAQTSASDGPYYTVQSGDTLWSIAALFGVLVGDLEQVNGLTDSDPIDVGMQLVIPGIQGYSGELSVQPVALGENLQTLSARHGIASDVLVQLNHLTSPNQLFIGDLFIGPVAGNTELAGSPVKVVSGKPLLAAAIVNGVSPWELAAANELAGPSQAIPGEVYTMPRANGQIPSILPVEFHSASLSPLPLTQGKTAEIRIQAAPELQLSGELAGQALNFFPIEDGYVALQGIHNQLDPGLYSLSIQVTTPLTDSNATGQTTFTQSVAVGSGNFIIDPPLNVDPATIDPAVTVPEDQLWADLAKPVTPDKLWSGLFASPVPPELKSCLTSLFGNRRTYNNGAYSSYHSGLDFCGQIGTPLYAPAAGIVVYTGPLKVRGNVTVIDHGWGVYTAYDHQSQILVKVGDVVTPGQEIGLGGDTGRTTGPHLHFEVWVGGVQVDPADWLKRAYP
jgi:murein DD-endopeptidase MepM/ murein hydrolase activator NlpD